MSPAPSKNSGFVKGGEYIVEVVIIKVEININKRKVRGE